MLVFMGKREKYPPYSLDYFLTFVQKFHDLGTVYHAEWIIQDFLNAYKNFIIRANSSGFRLAPPTRTPSISFSAINESILPAFTLPP